MTSGRSSKMGKLEHSFGSFRSLPIKLQQLIIETDRHGAAYTRKKLMMLCANKRSLVSKKEEIACQKD